MKAQPKEMMLCYLEVFVMPNGEVLCLGQSLGWFKKFAPALTKKPIPKADQEREP